MIDHTGLNVTDYARSKAFYTAALAPLGYVLLAEYPASVTGGPDVAGFGPPRDPAKPESPPFWIVSGTVGTPPMHLAFRARDAAMVQAFHAAAIAAGGRDNGAPGPRPQYHAGYYGAFVLDPDGYNVEAVCHGPA